jgi:hypothetical protein
MQEGLLLFRWSSLDKTWKPWRVRKESLRWRYLARSASELCKKGQEAKKKKKERKKDTKRKTHLFFQVITAATPREVVSM